MEPTGSDSKKLISLNAGFIALECAHSISFDSGEREVAGSAVIISTILPQVYGVKSAESTTVQMNRATTFEEKETQLVPFKYIYYTNRKGERQEKRSLRI